jgi:uncharacterized protein (DUF2141 family)
MNTYLKFIIVIVLLLSGNFLEAQILNVHIKNIRNTKGQLCLAIFEDQAAFLAEKTCWAMKCNKKNIVNGELNLQIPFRAGQWAFSVLDDENQNGKMDYNFIGIPLKGFGFSNYLHKGLHRPVFKDFGFNIGKNETKLITVQMKYF